MFYLHVSNRTENLLHHLAEVLKVDKQPDFFAAELFLVQSQGMERMVIQALADEFCSFCNYKFLQPVEFLSYITAKLDMGIAVDGFHRRILTWRLDELLRDISAEVYRPLEVYFSGENKAIKRFQLARRLANIFDQYQVMRSDMLTGWENGKRLTDNPTEAWQMELWRRLLDQPGGRVHRGMLYSQVIKRLNDAENLAEFLPKRISIIGLHTMSQVFLRYINALSDHMDVHLFLLSPCRNYWGDVESRRTQYKRLLRQVPDGQNLPDKEHHPLLGVLGRQGRDFHNMMQEGARFTLEFASYDAPLTTKEYDKAQLLRRVQADLLHGDFVHDKRDHCPQDNSIQVVSCHSKLRELTILKDHLWHLLQQKPHLELRDIVVMAPSIQEYTSLIPAVFTDIQHSIADRSIHGGNGIIAAFLVFLDLFTGRFTWTEVLEVLRHPAIYPQFQLVPADLDTLQRWVTGAGIRWGLSGEQRHEEGLPGFAETSWQAGLDRLLMGYAIDSDEFIDDVLPYTDIEGRGALPLGGLCRFVELIDQAHRDFRRQRKLNAWSKNLRFFIKELFGSDGSKDLLELQEIMADLSTMTHPFHLSTVDYGVICDWLNHLVKKTRSSSGFLRGQLTFCSMLPMRSIPFQVVCLIGLNDTAFPRSDIYDTFDLMGIDFRLGDRSPRTDDRYQFLEALLAARAHLYLSYIGQSNKINDEILPSVVVTEFLEVLATEYGVVNLVAKHPLHPFSNRYFDADSGLKLFSYNGYNCQVAQALLRGEQRPKKWWNGSLEQKNETVFLSDLLLFYDNPQRFFIKKCLDISLDRDEDLPDDQEIFELSSLNRYHVEQEMLQSTLSGDIFLKRLQVSGQWPLGSFGEVAFAEKKEEIEALMERMHGQKMGSRIADLSVDLTIDNYHLIGSLTNLYENGPMLVRYGNLRGRDILSAWIHHLISGYFTASPTTKTVALDTIVGFTGGGGGPDLKTLLTVFSKGCSSPSAFFIEPAFDYAKQLASTNSYISPLRKAVQTFNGRLKKGYEPEWELLLSGDEEGERLGSEFESLCREIMCPIWSVADEQ